MSVEEQVHGGRPPEGGRPAKARAGAMPGLRPVIAASVVLLLWLVWLLVPDGSDEGLSGAPQTPVSGEGRDLLSAAAPGARVPGGQDEAVAGAGPAADDPQAQAGEPEATEAEATDAEAAEVEAGESEAAASQVPVEPAVPVEVPQRGDGTFAVAAGGSEPVGSGALVRYTVEVEGGVPLEPAEVAAVVDGVLSDPRSWTADGSWTLQRSGTDPDVRIVVTSPDTTDAMCAPLRTGGRLSCRNGGVVVLNALRWTEGAEAWGDDLTGYRQYLVNHEVGHFLGHGHVPCPGEGVPAPVMLQQTLGLQGCAPNGWPFP